MQHNEKLVDALNDLVRINYDRIRGYEKAVEEVESEDVDLKALFNQYADQSREFLGHWQETVRSLGGEPVTDSKFSGKLYRVWMDFKAALTGHGRKQALDSCSFGEKAAIEEYDEALSTDANLPANIRQEIMDQKGKLEAALKSIQTYAEAHERIS